MAEQLKPWRRTADVAGGEEPFPFCVVCGNISMPALPPGTSARNVGDLADPDV
ncbi:MAG: hypothetical protein NT138_05970 [Planctomycetales bacterium]|jgi:hypothetical protein|nr:hypothetical protein [Planctomycetales bacterium]